MPSLTAIYDICGEDPLRFKHSRLQCSSAPAAFISLTAFVRLSSVRPPRRRSSAWQRSSASAVFVYPGGVRPSRRRTSASLYWTATFAIVRRLVFHNVTPTFISGSWILGAAVLHWYSSSSILLPVKVYTDKTLNLNYKIAIIYWTPFFNNNIRLQESTIRSIIRFSENNT